MSHRELTRILLRHVGKEVVVRAVGKGGESDNQDNCPF